jgi:Holliday junction DNA helicase RuvA
MIGSLRGRLLDRGPDGELLIEVGGVGHRVQVTPSTSVTIGELDGEVFVHTHHAVREDSETLYGFATIAERRVFESLISAHGVGPSVWRSCRYTAPTPCVAPSPRTMSLRSASFLASGRRRRLGS